MKKCKYYYEREFAETPLEPDNNIDKRIEGRCKEGRFSSEQKVFCGGNKDICDVERYWDEWHSMYD